MLFCFYCLNASENSTGHVQQGDMDNRLNERIRKQRDCEIFGWHLKFNAITFKRDKCKLKFRWKLKQNKKTKQHNKKSINMLHSSSIRNLGVSFYSKQHKTPEINGIILKGWYAMGLHMAPSVWWLRAPFCLCQTM